MPGTTSMIVDLDVNGYIYEITFSDDLEVFDANDPDDADILKTTLNLEDEHIQALQHNDWIEVEKEYPAELTRYLLASTLKDIGYDAYYNWDETRGYMNHVSYNCKYGNNEIGLNTCNNLEFEAEASAIVFLNAKKIKTFKKYEAKDFLQDNNICLPRTVAENMYMEKPLRFVDWYD